MPSLSIPCTTDLSRMTTPPTDLNHASSLVSSTKLRSLPRLGLAAKLRSRTTDDLSGFESYPPPTNLTKEERVPAVASLPDVQPDLRGIEQYRIVSVSGEQLLSHTRSAYTVTMPPELDIHTTPNNF